MPKRMDRVWTANKFRLLREFYAIVGFERVKTQLRVKIDALLRGFTWFLRCLRRSYTIRVQFICATVQILRGASVAYNHAFALFTAFPCLCAEMRGLLMRDPCIYAVVGLCDRALMFAIKSKDTAANAPCFISFRWLVSFFVHCCLSSAALLSCKTSVSPIPSSPIARWMDGILCQIPFLAVYSSQQCSFFNQLCAASLIIYVKTHYDY